MTIIVAAYCDDARCGVVAADRMAVRGAGSSAAQRDDAISKIVKLTDSLVIANTGYALDAKYVADAFCQKHEGLDKSSVSEVCRFVSQTLAELQTKKRDAEVQRQLGPGFTYNSIAEACAKGVGGHFLDVLKAANDLNYGEFLMIGFENGRVTIRCDPSPQTLGVVEVAHVATGSGYHYAHAAMTIADHTKAVDVETAVFNVYCGMKAAAVSYGVGSKIDMAIVTSHGARFVPKSVIETLEEVRLAKSLKAKEKKLIREGMKETGEANTEGG